MRTSANAEWSNRVVVVLTNLGNESVTMDCSAATSAGSVTKADLTLGQALFSSSFMVDSNARPCVDLTKYVLAGETTEIFTVGVTLGCNVSLSWFITSLMVMGILTVVGFVACIIRRRYKRMHSHISEDSYEHINNYA
jgi:hypothetical protein